MRGESMSSFLFLKRTQNRPKRTWHNQTFNFNRFSCSYIFRIIPIFHDDSLSPDFRFFSFYLLKQKIVLWTGKKRYSSSWFYGQGDDNFPTIEEQVELCRKIASQLVNDENRESKGASMFYKRLKRAPKWVHQFKDESNMEVCDYHRWYRDFFIFGIYHFIREAFWPKIVE